MNKTLLLLALAIGILIAPNLIRAEMISEFEPAPVAGAADSTFELFGTAGAAFDLNIISIENDGFNGIIDRATNVTGVFDSNGLALVDVPDLENPSFTVLLTELFTGAIGDDLDAANDGTLDVSGFGTIFDSVGVSDIAGDDSSLYSTALGGSSILFNGFGEPAGVFRDGSTGDWFQYVTVGADIQLFAASGGPALDVTDFSSDPTATSFGSINPTLNAVPEPSTLAFASLIGLGLGLVRRRK